MFAAHHRLSNLVAVVDLNGQQALGYTKDVLDLSPMADRWRAFGWDVHEVDGHDPVALADTIRGLDTEAGPPHVLVAHTIFGKGVSFMESSIEWHYLPMTDGTVRAGHEGGGGVRATFIRTLVELAEEDERIVLLTGDLGFTVVEPFAERFPDRFFNVGVAEQNMVGVATGLAEAGFVPFAYSIATFATLRSYEFVRNGPVLHHLPVRIVGVGGGLEYGMNGLTHYALEDIAVMRAQPGMTVLAPADFQQARTALIGDQGVPGPIYFRLGKNETETVPGLDGRLRLGGVEQIGAGPRRRDRRHRLHHARSGRGRRAPRGPGLAFAARRRRLPEPGAHGGTGHRAAKRPARGHRRGALPDRRARLARLRGRRRVGPRLPRRPLRRRGPPGRPSGARRSSTTRTACRRAAIARAAARGTRPARHDRGPGRRPMKKLSAVIACYRDAPAIPEMYERLTETFRSIGVDYEIIFVNDASPDNAREVLAELAASDPRGGRRQPHAELRLAERVHERPPDRHR